MPDNGTNVVQGTPLHADNTGRDVGEAVGIGGALVASVLGAILTWGTATPAFIAADSALIAGTTAANIASKVSQNAEDARNQQRSEQGRLDAAQKARPSGPPQPMKKLDSMAKLDGLNGMKTLPGTQVADPNNPGMKMADPNATGGGMKQLPQMQQLQKLPQQGAPPTVEQAPQAMNITDGSSFTGAPPPDAPPPDGVSDKRAKKNVSSGNKDLDLLLSLVRKK